MGPNNNHNEQRNQPTVVGIAQYGCGVCGAQYPSAIYICPKCGTPGSVRYIPGDKQDILSQHTGSAILTEDEINKRAMAVSLKTGVDEIDKVVGEALTPGSTIFVGGRKGLGKSTIVMQIARYLSQLPDIKKVWYFSTEEEEDQVKVRAKRLKCISEKIGIYCPTFTLDIVLNKLANEDAPDLLIVDSISNLVDSHESARAGSVKQISCCSQRLVAVTKTIKKFPLILTSGVAKTGLITGPERVVHLVDVILYIERVGKTKQRYLKCIKNRYSPTDEIGLFTMEDEGLIPSQLHIKTMGDINGSRAGISTAILFLERIPVGIEVKTDIIPPDEDDEDEGSGKRPVRMQIIENYLPSRKKIILKALEVSNCAIDKDFFCKLPVKIEQENVELAIAASIFSAFKNISIPSHVIFLGELSPNGEIKETGGINDRLEYAAKQGFKTVISGTNIPAEMSHGLKCWEFNTLAELFKAIKETDASNKKESNSKLAMAHSKRKGHWKKKQKQKPKKLKLSPSRKSSNKSAMGDIETGIVKIVSKIPRCDFCGEDAVCVGKTKKAIDGHVHNMCGLHWAGLGISKRQILEIKKK